MGEEDNKCDIWGLSLSLRPPIITNLDNNNNNKPLCKREHHFLAESEQSTKLHKQNKSSTMMPMTMEVDIKPPMVIDLEEVEINKVGSPNSTLSSATGKRLCGFRVDRDVVSDDDEGGGGGSNGEGGDQRKKLRLSKEQIMVLEQAFKEHTTLNTKQKMALARQVSLKPRQVEVWFQNRRARTKLKQTEVDCEQLRRFCETLTDQNRKLLKEVQELRALKLSPDHQSSVMHGKSHLGNTLNMCPSCKTVSLSPSAATTSKTPTGVLHRPVPLNLNKLSLTINNNRLFR